MGNQAPAITEGGEKLGMIRTLASVMSRMTLFNRLGWTHEGNRRLYEVFGYKKTPSYEDYFEKYMRQDIAARVVDAFPAAVWSSPPVIEGSRYFNKDWEALNIKFRIFTVLQRLDRLLGMGTYACLLIGLDDGQDLSTPARARQGLKVIYLQPYSSKAMMIEKFEENSKDPRYGLPLMYKLTDDEIGDGTNVQASTKKFKRQETLVHWSRVVHVVEDPLENEVYGIPRLQRVYNILDDLLKVVGGTAEAFWMNANRGMQANVDKDMTFTEADANALSDEIDEYVHGLRRFMRTRGVEVTSLGANAIDPRGVFDVLVTMLAGALGIPKRILLGSEAGQLASEQDRTNWANRIEERRANFAEPSVLWPLFNRLIDLKVIRKGPTTFAWPSAFRMSPLEKAQVAAQKARSAANLQKIVDAYTKAKQQSEQSGQTEEFDVTDPETGAVSKETRTTPKLSEPDEPLLSHDEMRRIILTDEIQPEISDPGAISSSDQ